VLFKKLRKKVVRLDALKGREPVGLTPLENRKDVLAGFSLVELLVVIAIITGLLSILMPGLRKVRLIAMQLKCTHNIKQIDIAMNLYLSANDNFFPCAADPLPTGYWLWMGRGWRSFVEPFLGGNIDANNPSVLFCPMDYTAKEKYESTSYAYSMVFYHSPQQIDGMSSSEDTYNNPLSCVRQRTTEVARPSGKILIGEWLSNHEPIGNDSGWWCWEGSRNFLFADGQVRMLPAKQIRPARDGLPDANLTVNGIKGADWPASE
jgi:prepilin-type N-terminal cleavage/methylation domain-containing protein/prepilin-type processing-associated H-X9-DG protein